MIERLSTSERHDSMRGWFGWELHYQMQKNKDIFVITADLGYGLFDRIRDDFPDRFLNCGAAEQAAVGVAVGLAKEGKIPFVYSITPFLLYRPFETIRNYIHYEGYAVKLVMSGRDFDYKHDGWSHHSPDAYKILEVAFPNIRTYWPEKKEEVPEMVKEIVHNREPSAISLRRG